MRPKKIRSLIIDDDPFITDLLQDKLSLHFPEIDVISTANNGLNGIQQIEKYQPSLVFLDIEMMDMTGFEMLSQLTTINFQTIFITSYSHYAIKAIRFNALDYLVKPINLDELKKAIQRFKDKIHRTQQKVNLNLALQNAKTQNIAQHKLVLQTQEGEIQLSLEHIIRLEGERNYSYIYLTNHKKKLVTKTLANLEEMLSQKGFFRCHKSFLVNGHHIKTNTNNTILTMSDNAEIPISRRKKETFKTWYQSY